MIPEVDCEVRLTAQGRLGIIGLALTEPSQSWLTNISRKGNVL